MLTPGMSRAEYDPENPSYASWHHYTNDTAWAGAALERLQRWRFTTVGAWSDLETFGNSESMLPGITPVLHIGSTAGAPWWDMWDEKIIDRMDSAAREQILKVRDNPRLIGYYTDNEMGWWNATLFHMALEQPSASGQRQRLLKLLRETYQNDWSRLVADFEPEFADNWEGLEQRGQLWLRGGGQGVRVMRQFLAVVAARYYQLVHDIIRKYDQRALILGDRYQSFYYPEVARAAAPYVDAISSNLNANWNDGSFVRFYLETLHRITGKPVFVSEFYLAAYENASGNRNTHGVFPRVQTQRERAVAVENTLKSLAALPFVVGADWFQYFDEPRHGRGDGENYNFGLVNIFDRPYGELTTRLAKLDLNRLKDLPSPPQLDANAGIPRAPRDPFKGITGREALQEWNRGAGFLPPTGDLPVADMYVCWDSRAIYLGLHAYDIVEDAYYRNKSVPKQDRALWTIHAGNEPIRARIGAQREPLINDGSIRIENQSGVNLNVHNIAIIEIPAARFGRKRFSHGDHVLLHTTLETHARAYSQEWKGEFTLGK